MSDYTDIALHLKQAKEELLIVKEIIKKDGSLARKTNPVDAYIFEENLDQLLRSLDNELDRTEEYTNLIEDAINGEKTYDY